MFFILLSLPVNNQIVVAKTGVLTGFFELPVWTPFIAKTGVLTGFLSCRCGHRQRR